MAGKQAVGDNPVSSIGATRPRFSLISLFAGNQSSSRSSFKGKRQKSGRKSKSKAGTESSFSASAPAPTETAPAATATTPPCTPDVSDSMLGLDIKVCPLCYDDLPLTAYPTLSLTCGHRSCSNCLQEYLKIEIGESRVDISCPECKERLHPADIHNLLYDNPACMAKYEEFMVRRVLVTDPDTRWCPAPDCGYAVIAAGCASCPMLKCQRPGCDTHFCYHCKQEWHANQTCDAARMERLPIMRLSLSDVRSLARTADEYKSCPRCKTMINKMDDGSCNHMTCSICGAQFCWLCLKEASDLHYLSPSGCTFWGKKPWSKKKKILWQLGTLIGAPLGIALIAGLSVPVLIFGLPIWAGRKLHQRCKNYKKHKRNAVIIFGTVGALIASPIVAAVTIAIGVPVMLAYVYGVVPYSLCRGGTCGVKNDGGTFSFDFGGSNDEHAGRGNNGAFLVGNPSIGPGSIGESSLAAAFALSASGVQMDRVGLPDDQSDTKSASMKNMVGSSITGSLDDPDVQKMEIRADVSLRPTATVERKNSIDSQTLSQADNRSLRSFALSDNRSHVSFNVDNASMKALAGSICAQRERDVALPHDLVSDVPNKSCMKGEHGSPISNRSVSFAAHDKKTKHKTKHSSKRRRELEKGDKLSVRSLDALSTNPCSADALPVGKRCTEYKPRTVVSEIAQRGVADIVHRGSSDGTSVEAAVGAAQLTVVDVDQLPPLSTTSPSVVFAAKSGGGVGDRGSCTHCTVEKALCNIQEQHGHI